MPSQCLVCPEVAISRRIHLWEGKSASNRPCESSIASPDRCGQEPWILVALWGRADVVTAGFPRTRLSGSRLSWPRLAKARSGLVPTFQRREKKLAVSFGLYNSPRLLDAAHAARCWMQLGTYAYTWSKSYALALFEKKQRNLWHLRPVFFMAFRGTETVSWWKFNVPT